MNILIIRQSLNRLDHMGSIGHRAIVQYLESNDLFGLKTFLDTRHVQVDDREEVTQLNTNINDSFKSKLITTIFGYYRMDLRPL